MSRIQTPWGWSDPNPAEVAPGITFYSTPSHGGFLLSPERRAAMPSPYREAVTFAGGNWYEEDCDAALVILAFPDLFKSEQLDAARAIYAVYHSRKVPA